jgi:predicted dehydrogenase
MNNPDMTMKCYNRRSFLQVSRNALLGLTTVGVLGKSTLLHGRTTGGIVKIGQIGTGHAHAAGKMATLRKLDQHFEVVGIVEPDKQRLQRMQKRSAYRDIPLMTEEQLLNTPGLQAVAVETAVRDLVPTGLRCIKSGMHIHLDKPAGEHLSQLRTLLDEANRRRQTVQMGYMFRHNPAFQFCFRAVREGWLGEIFAVHGVMSKTMDSEGRKELVQYSGGTMFELGCHLIDALIKVTGRPERVTPFIRHTQTDIDLADNQLSVFEYPKATATIRSALMEVEGQKRRQFVVCGDRGTVDIKPLEPPRVLLALSDERGSHKKGYQEIEMPVMPGRYDDQLIDLAEIIREEKESDYAPSHDLAVHEAVLRASGLPLH